MIILGADPGLDGALVFFDAASRRIVKAINMPTLSLSKSGAGTNRVIDLAGLWSILSEANKEFDDIYAFVEFVAASPQMGVSSAFKFGGAYMALRMGITAGRWSNELITPAKWKRTMQVGAEKEDALARINALLPKDHEHWAIRRNVLTKAEAIGIADAALIALYGEMWLRERGLLDVRKPKRMKFEMPV